MTMTLSRRTALAAAGGLAVAGLAGCRSGGPATGPETTAPAATGLELPTYQPYADAPFDFEPTPEGGIGGVFEFPEQDTWISTGVENVAEGEKIEVFGPAPGGGTPPPPERNSFLQEIWRRMGGELRVIYVPSSGDLQDKFATLIAGNALPDLCRIMPIPQLAGMLESQFTDLTEHLAGDAILDYPNLANLPQRAWQSAVVNGRIYGLPKFAGAVGESLMMRTDHVGIDEVDLSDGEDFLALCREVSNPSQNRWAITQPHRYIPMLEECMGGVNGWKRQDDGTFIHSYQTEQYVEALEVLRGMWADELIHPDAYGQSGSGFVQIPKGSVTLHWNDFAQWRALLRNNQRVDPNFNVIGVLPPAWHGGERQGHFTVRGDVSSVVVMGIPKTDPDRVKLLLRIANWLASPFGTEENVLLSYGIPGEHFSMGADGAIEQTDLAEQELNVGIASVRSTPALLWAPGVKPDDVRSMYDYQNTMLDGAVDDDSLGLFSETQNGKAASLKSRMDDAAVSIITNRAAVSTWADMVDDWLAGGGQEMADEYRDAWEQANS